MTLHTSTGRRASGYANAQRSVRSHVIWAVAIVATGLLLALAGCGGGARHQGQGNSGVTQQQNGGGSTSSTNNGSSANSNPAAVQGVDSLDQQSQNDAQSVDGTYNDANVGYSSQDTEQHP
ncbi:MAG: hypothetical protein ABI068_03735 [Ktedonobacterales bacterium]